MLCSSQYIASLSTSSNNFSSTNVDQSLIMLLWGLLFSRLYLICGICWWPREWLWAVHQGAGRHPPPCMDIKRVQPGAVGPQRVPPHLHPQVHHYHPCKVHKKGATGGTWTTTTPTPMIRSTHSSCIKREQLWAPRPWHSAVYSFLPKLTRFTKKTA